MMKRFHILFLLFWSIGSLSAQDFELPRFQISLSYFGEMISHRGIRLGITTPISQKTIEKRGSDSIDKAWIIGGYLTYYKHPRNHKGFIFSGAIGRQRIGANGFQTSIQLEAGYMLSILDGETFEWKGSEIIASNSKASSHIVFGFNGGLGWNFDKKTNLPLSFMVKPHLYLQAPYNTLLVPRMALETQLSYHIK